jgi:hypothetical protein
VNDLKFQAPLLSGGVSTNPPPAGYVTFAGSGSGGCLLSPSIFALPSKWTVSIQKVRFVRGGLNVATCVAALAWLLLLVILPPLIPALLLEEKPAAAMVAIITVATTAAAITITDFVCTDFKFLHFVNDTCLIIKIETKSLSEFYAWNPFLDIVDLFL